MPTRSQTDDCIGILGIDASMTKDCKCDFIDTESPVFAVDDDSTTGDELTDYEMSYLHSLHHGGDLEDAILPVNEAPPSLGLPAAALKPQALSALGLKGRAAEARAAVAHLDVLPHDAHDSWDDSDMTPSPRCASPVPEQLGSKPTAKARGGAHRKRKAGADAASTPAKMAKTVTAVNAVRACSPDIDSAGSSRSSSESPSVRRPMLDGMEIRPEDDPLGLFSRDPSTLTVEEQRLLKKQRRLLKNRESAQLSRHRKKCHLHTLEKQVEALKREKEAMQEQLQELLEENKRLRQGV